MSTRFVKVGSSVEAWSLIRSLVAPVVADMDYPAAPGFVKDEESSARAGYSVYRLADWRDAYPGWRERLYYNYVSDLGGVLELNTCGADWSGDVYRIAVVSDGDGLQAAAVPSPVQSSAVAGATPAGSSDNGAADPDLVVLRLRRSDVCRVSSALLGVKFDFIEEALPLQVDDPRRGVCIRSARAWDALRQEVRRQLQEHDARRGCGVDPWEVA